MPAILWSIIGLVPCHLVHETDICALLNGRSFRGTKVYRLDSSTDGRSWKTLKQETLPWTRVCPFPLHRVNVNVRARWLNC